MAEVPKPSGLLEYLTKTEFTKDEYTELVYQLTRYLKQKYGINDELSLFFTDSKYLMGCKAYTDLSNKYLYDPIAIEDEHKFKLLVYDNDGIVKIKFDKDYIANLNAFEIAFLVSHEFRHIMQFKDSINKKIIEKYDGPTMYDCAFSIEEESCFQNLQWYANNSEIDADAFAQDETKRLIKFALENNMQNKKEIIGAAKKVIERFKTDNLRHNRAKKIEDFYQKAKTILPKRKVKQDELYQYRQQVAKLIYDITNNNPQSEYSGEIIKFFHDCYCGESEIGYQILLTGLTMIKEKNAGKEKCE